MSTHAHPVFGPERADAAHAAVTELHAAATDRDESGGGWAPERCHQRLTEARRVAGMYWERLHTDCPECDYVSRLTR